LSDNPVSWRRAVPGSSRGGGAYAKVALAAPRRGDVKVCSTGSHLNIHTAAVELEQRTARWPAREDLSNEFTRLLGSAQEGGATVAECCMTANRIDSSDDLSWHREWKRIADVNRERGDAALARGALATAKSNWLRAIGYYQSAAFPFDRSDRNSIAAAVRMQECARKFLQHRAPPGEVVEIPWPDGYPLEAYFLPAGDAAAPALICIGEPGQRKEEFLYKAARYAGERGISLLAVDLLGAGAGAQFEQAVRRGDLERTIGHIMNYLVERNDVDATRIAILADGWGSSFVARGIAFDDRFAAAACDGGVWDMHERAFLLGRLQSFDGSLANRGALSVVCRNIKCPVLISAGEQGWLKTDRIREMYESLRAGGCDLTLKIFTAEETAAAQGHADNPTLANEFIFDWIAARLGLNWI
jgi:dienelactone hydrolase